MRLPNLSPVENLPLNFPPIKENQVWALNQDTNPASLVLIEFVYSEQPQILSASQESVNLLNTTINQTLSSISAEINNLSSRLTTLESILNTSNFTTSPQGALLAQPTGTQ